MTANVAMVYDSDSLVTYAGTWVNSGVPLQLKKTTEVQGFTVSFIFEGSSIGAYATVAAVNPLDASLVFAVDNSISGTYTPPGHSLLESSAAGVSFELQFEGKSISMWGAINNGSTGQVMNVSMTIDGGPPIFFVPPIQTAAVTNNNLMFDSGELPNGAHTLVVTADDNYTVWVDYFLVTPATTMTTTSAHTSSPSHSHTSLNIAAVVGAPVGGVILLLTI
ncbi:hypothetical protein K438DRAFT_1981414 [Mycena galopus ATCC 62051]|nr:hypothetical protein K438DRAFT_1981414 [Mycena galopus ATCC 62051]